MNGAERNGSEQETEVVAKPRRRRFTVEYKRKAVGATVGKLPFFDPPRKRA